MSDAIPTILILEDNEDISDLLSQLIVSYGAVPTVCANEECVRDLLRKRPISLALIDIMMPGLDGRKMARIIHEHDASIPLYYMTGMPETDIGVEALSWATGLLKKPFAIPQLRAILDPIISKNAIDTGAAKQELLEILAALATEQESVKRQQRALETIIQGLPDEKAAELTQSIAKHGQSIEESMRRFSAQLEQIRTMLDNED